jgi:hypothetical protein
VRVCQVEAIALLQSSPRQTKLDRALYHTYIQPAATQELAAELLDLAFSTYRRHPDEEIENLMETLWQRKTGVSRGRRDDGRIDFAGGNHFSNDLPERAQAAWGGLDGSYHGICIASVTQILQMFLEGDVILVGYDDCLRLVIAGDHRIGFICVINDLTQPCAQGIGVKRLHHVQNLHTYTTYARVGKTIAALSTLVKPKIALACLHWVTPYFCAKLG